MSFNIYSNLEVKYKAYFPNAIDEYVNLEENQNGMQYSVEFKAIPKDIIYKSQKTIKKPKIYGIQTAIVIGEENKENSIDVDDKARVKVLFHFEKNKTASCYLRVTNLSSGNNYGSDRLYDLEVMLEVVNCYCNRDFTVDEVKNIVKELRDSEEETKGKYGLFTASNCKLPQSDKTYERFTEELNKTFKKYEINTCLRKIHFLAQVYHETANFQTTEEIGSGNKYDPSKHPDAIKNGNTQIGDGPKYKGRGLMQLTWKTNYEKYNPSMVSNYNKLSDELSIACDSAGWFWQQGKILGTANTNLWKAPSFNGLVGEAVKKENPSSIKVVRTYGGNKNKYGTLDLNKLADNDWIDTISWLVNGGKNGFFERRKYLKKLKEIMKYENCGNKN